MKHSLTAILSLCLLAAPLSAQVYEANPSNLSSVLKQVQKQLRKPQKEDIVIQLAGGTYQFAEPLDLDQSFSGRDGHTVTLRAAQGQTPIFSGGRTVTGWQCVNGNLWKAPLSCPVKLRSLLVNGRRAVMAAAHQRSQGGGILSKFEITGDEPWAFGAGEGVDGIKLVDPELTIFRNAEDVEIVQEKVWTEKILCVREMDKWGDTIVVRFQQPAGAIINSMAWAGKIDYNKLFYVRNAYELLDEPGEFYFDRAAQTLFYMCREGEDMTTAEVIAPSSEGLLRLHGESLDKQIHDIRIEGITFAYDTWNLMPVEGSRGFGSIQTLGLAIKYIPDGNWHPTKYNSCDTPMGCVDVRSARGIQIEGCRFEHLGCASAVTLLNDVSESAVTGCVFNDIFGNAVTVGHPQHYEIGDGEGIYSPSVEGLCHDIQITNNFVRNTSIDFRQVEAILGFFVRDVHIDHNDILGCPYGAIALGWWWGNAKTPEPKLAGNNTISFNRVGQSHQLLSDGGIVYMLGPQPGSVIEGNYLFKGPRCIYPDDGSSGWKIHDNVINSVGQLWFHIDSDRDYDIETYHNYVKANNTANSGRGTTITDTQTFRNVPFSAEAEAIMEASGLEPKWKHILPAEEPEVVRIYPNFDIKKW